MKKYIIMFLALFISGCSLNKDPLDGALVRTTTYPITYLTNKLYGEFAEVVSIYPEGAISSKYKLNDKLITKYAKCDLFIYNGLTEEKNIAKKFVNKNKRILLIDVSYGLSVQTDTEELWLSPNNYLMLAKNIKDHLLEYLNNKYIKEQVVENYNTLAEELSLMDVDMRNLGTAAIEKNNNTILTTANQFKYLENYGFNVISLENIDLSDEVILENFKSKQYIAFINDYSIKNNLTNNLMLNYSTRVVNFNNITDNEVLEDYISIMNKFITDLESIVLD